MSLHPKSWLLFTITRHDDDPEVTVESKKNQKRKLIQSNKISTDENEIEKRPWRYETTINDVDYQL